ncbi:OmpH family outer membrane protein [Akkermansiaceae bacterium]|nr:OmpH family outer membrane protein [Akkermansiaceae bacterium]
MKFSLSLLWIALTVMSPAASKLAVVRVTDIYRELPSTAAMQKEIQGQRDAILLNKRAEQLRAIIGQLQLIQSQLQAKKDELESEDGRKLVREYEIKRQEAETLRQEFEKFREAEDKRINRMMVEAMRASLGRIMGAAEQLAKEQNLDGVLDISGSSNTGVPFVLYVKDPVDLSDGVIALLDEKPLDEAPKEPEAQAEADKPEG